MTKEQFIKLIKELVAIKKAEDNLNKAFKKFEPEFNYIGFGRYETLVVRALEFAMNDTQSQWISYWLYDCNCGKDAKIVQVKDNSGKNIPFKTVSDLYNCIKNN